MDSLNHTFNKTESINTLSVLTVNLTKMANTTINPLFKYYKEHAGHETMHMKIALFLFVSVVLSHLTVMYWKSKHFKSYQFVTTIILYGLSLVYCINSGSLTLKLSWIFFTLSIVWVLFLIRCRLNNRATPKLIYRFFRTMHSIATLMAIICLFLYILLILAMTFESGSQSKLVQSVDEMFSVILLNTILFGVLYQDTAAIITGTLFTKRGIHLEGQLPTQNQHTSLCLICGLNLFETTDLIHENTNVCTINCGHAFHDDCIRGWCVIGKKDTCPYCFEKCDLRSRLIQPWEKTELYYGDLLWFLRLLLAWNPIIVIAVVYITRWIGWK